MRARHEACFLELLLPRGRELRELGRRRRKQRELHATGQRGTRQFVAVDDDRVTLPPGVPGKMQVLDRRREHLALLRAELTRQVLPSVEPDVAEAQALL